MILGWYGMGEPGAGGGDNSKAYTNILKGKLCQSGANIFKDDQHQFVSQQDNEIAYIFIIFISYFFFTLMTNSLKPQVDLEGLVYWWMKPGYLDMVLFIIPPSQ